MSATAIKNYGLVIESDPQTLIAAVTRLLEDGFQPLGGLSMSREPGAPGQPAKTLYGQAVIRLWQPGERNGGLIVNGQR